MRDTTIAGAVIATHESSSIIHCAAFLPVKEGVRFPLARYPNNFDPALAIHDVASIHGMVEPILPPTATVHVGPARPPPETTRPLPLQSTRRIQDHGRASLA